MNKNELPDIQQNKPEIERIIQQVGVQSVEVPFMLRLKKGGLIDLVANVSMRSNIESDIKGVSMSRFILTLKEYLHHPLNHHTIKDILLDLCKNVGSSNSFMKFEFKLPIEKKSILSDNSFPIYYKCKFEGQILNNNDFKFYQGIEIQYSSYCPCSAALSKDLLSNGSDHGFPHAQRSFADILIETKESNYVWLEDIVQLIQDSIVTQPYPIIKRIDEQEIAKIASKNPIFVEDAIRLISETLDNKMEIYDWIVKCSHEESIHTSEAIAICWKGIEGGFNGNYYL